MQRVPTKNNIDVAKAAWRLMADTESGEVEMLALIFNDATIREKSKIYVLDKVYNCNLYLDEKGYDGLSNMLEHEYKKRIDRASSFTEADKIVEEIADKKYIDDLGLVYSRKRSIGPVFASKYCYFTKLANPGQDDLFIIYDKYADIAINYLCTDRHTQKYWGNYTGYTFKVREILAKLKPEVNYRDFDKYLWLFGQTLKKTKTIKYLEEKKQFEDLKAKLCPPQN